MQWSRDHACCSFLALVPRQELRNRCHAVGFRPDRGGLRLDLDRPQEVEPAKGGKRMILRMLVTGSACRLF